MPDRRGNQHVGDKEKASVAGPSACEWPYSKLRPP